ncbi:MAG: DUF1295 domain-containing protein, partial [Chitinophagaceae bacterium]
MSQLQSVIFTERYPARLLRHMFFWVGQVCFWAFLNASIFGDRPTLVFLSDDLRLHSFFLPDLVYTYFVTYFLAPRYLPAKKFRAFLLSLGGATVITYLFFLLMRFYDYGMFDAPIERKLHLVWIYSIKFMNLGPPVICAMFLLAELRLAVHLWKRVVGHLDEEEGRYQQLRKEWAPNANRNFFFFFQFQAISNVL